MYKGEYAIKELIATNKFEQYCINQKPYIIWRQLTSHDSGIDGEIEFTTTGIDGRAVATGETKKVVIKSTSRTYKNKPEVTLRTEHLEYYKKSKVEVIIVIYHIESDELFSVDIGDIEIKEREGVLRIQRIRSEHIHKINIKNPNKSKQELKAIRNSSTGKYSKSRADNKETLLIKKLNDCLAGIKNWRDYEDICLSIIDYLFRKSFRNYTRFIQPRNENGLDIKDLIIPNRSQNPFWNEIRMDYSARNVVFEFKNYGKKIGKNQLVQTSNYLKKKTYGRFAIIFSRKGLSKNGQTEQLELLRDDDKLIISLSDEDLIELIRQKSKGNNAEDVLEKLKTELELKI